MGEREGGRGVGCRRGGKGEDVYTAIKITRDACTMIDCKDFLSLERPTRC